MCFLADLFQLLFQLHCIMYANVWDVFWATRYFAAPLKTVTQRI